MRVTRAHFKYALRFVRNQEDMARADSLAQDLSDQDVDGFWKTMHKMNNCNTILANVIDGMVWYGNILFDIVHNIIENILPKHKNM